MESFSAVLNSGWRCDSSTAVTIKVDTAGFLELAATAEEMKADSRATSVASRSARLMLFPMTKSLVSANTSRYSARLLEK